jgi:hypothetical protein
MGDAVMSQAMSQSLVTAQDARPVVQRRDGSIWEEAEKRRDALYAGLQDAVREQGYEAAVLKSREFEHPAWVSIEAWIPSGDGVTRRRRAFISIVAKAFHEHKFEYTLVLRDGDWTHRYPGLRSFDRADVDSAVAFVIGATRKPPKWKRPRGVNHVEGLKWDPFRLHAKRTLRPKRRPVVLSSGKPKAEPRSLVPADSWQAMISGLGKADEEVREQFLDALAKSPIVGSAHRIERIWYWGLDGKIEREQIVVSLRRGVVFCHIDAYQSELYVGWDAHLNAGQWVEKTVAKGKSKNTGQYTTVKSVERGTQPLTEYDLIDLSCLSEWVHNQLVKIVKELMDTRQLKQELDFKINRGKRPDVDPSGSADEEEPAPRRRRSPVRTG